MCTTLKACDSWTGTAGCGEIPTPPTEEVREIDRKSAIGALAFAIDYFGLDDLLGLTVQDVIDLAAS